MDKTAKEIQALLFAEGGSLSFKSLEKLVGCTPEALQESLTKLSESLAGSGLSLILSDTEAVLAVSADAKDAVIKKANEEVERDIGDAGLEVLAILLYEGPSTRSAVDYIRGVNSTSTLRNLLSRGLVERSGNPEDGREYIYRATVELLAHLGIQERTELPEYGTISGELTAFKNTNAPEPGTSGTTAT